MKRFLAVLVWLVVVHLNNGTIVEIKDGKGMLVRDNRGNFSSNKTTWVEILNVERCWGDWKKLAVFPMANVLYMEYKPE